MARMKKISVLISEAHILGAVSALGLSPAQEESVLDAVEKKLHEDGPVDIDLARLREEDKDDDLRVLPMILGIAALLQIAVDMKEGK